MAIPEPEEIDRLQATADRRLNVGCGEHPLPFWTNLDAAPLAIADIHAYVPPLPYGDESLDEIYAGHFLEHLERDDVRPFLAECYRCLVPGGRLGIVVPDVREVMKRYLAGSIDAVEYPMGTWWAVADLDAVCAMFLYSNVQESPHRWSYDETSLARIMQEAGFVNLRPICRYTDPRIPQGAWYQFGLDGWKPE